MKFLGLKHSILSVLCLTLCVSACSRTNKSSNLGTLSGTQDIGGGSVKYSTPVQVNEALDKAIDLVTNQDPEENIVVQFWLKKGKHSWSDFIKSPAHLFPKLASLQLSEVNLKDHLDLFESPALQAFKHNVIIRKESGNCLTPMDGRHTDASVSGLHINADICFSIENLTRIPPSSLLKEILSLVVHEAAHLGGANEEEASIWQDRFSEYFSDRFGDLTSGAVYSDTFKKLASVEDYLERANRIPKTEGNLIKVYGLVGKMIQALESLPFLEDELALEMHFPKAKKFDIQKYTGRVRYVIGVMKIQFEIQKDEIHVNSIRWKIPLSFMRAEDIPQKLKKYQNYIDHIDSFFFEIAKGRVYAPKCELESEPVDIETHRCLFR